MGLRGRDGEGGRKVIGGVFGGVLSFLHWCFPPLISFHIHTRTSSRYRAGTLMVERCQSPELAIRPEEFAHGVQNLVEKVRDQTMSLSQVHIADILSVIMHLVREHHVRLAGDFVNVFVSILILEGIGRRLNPDLDLLKVALPILRDVGRVRAEQGLLEGAKDRVLPGREVIWGAGLFLRLWVWMETVQWVSVQWGGREKLLVSDLFVPDV